MSLQWLADDSKKAPIGWVIIGYLMILGLLWLVYQGLCCP